MYETQLLREGSMERQELILKYFYMIDPAQIINQLAEHPIPKDTSDTKTIDDFFHTIFEKIYRASTLYDRYLDPTYNSFDSFFGEPGCTSSSIVDYRRYTARLEHMRAFLKLSLRNHCITQGFFNSLSEKNSDEHVFLTGTYDAFLNSGYFSNPKYVKENYKKVESDSRIHQKYHSKFNALKKLGEDSFIWRVLVDSSLHMNGAMPSDAPRFRFKVPLVYKHWIRSCFINYRTGTLSGHIKKESKDTYSLYETIYNDFQSDENLLEHPLDKFVFHTMSEYYLGFSTLSYINSLMGKIQNSPSDEDAHLKRYRGQILESTLNRLSNCPMPYARHLFFTYALEALRYNENVECKFLSSTPGIGMKRSSMTTPFTDEERDALGLRLIPRFFNTLNHITLPILSSLWRIVSEKLIEDKELLFELYKTYVTSHDRLLTADLSTLSFEDMADCCSEKSLTTPQNDICASFSLAILEQKLSSEDSNRSTPFADKVFHQKALSSMICDFLKMSQDRSDSPYVYKLFQTEQTDTSQKYELDLFRFNRANNIFKLFSSKW